MNVSTVSKMILHAVGFAVTFSLIVLGMQVPNVSRLQPPKPRPRAVIETTFKAEQEAVAKIWVVAEGCRSLTPLSLPKSFRSLPPETIAGASHAPLELRAARAPPAHHA